MSVVVMPLCYRDDDTIARHASGVSLVEGLAAHLNEAFWPPVPPTLVPTCIRALGYAEEFSKWNESEAMLKMLDLPSGFLFYGSSTLRVIDLMEVFNLYPFVKAQERQSAECESCYREAGGCILTREGDGECPIGEELASRA
jgi:hypothetical protein